MENTSFSTNKTLNLKGRLLDLRTPVIMGIANVTPDSFYEGSRVKNPAALMKLAEQMVGDGAALLDIGGYSSRPGAEDIPAADELTRVIPAIRMLTKEFPHLLISVDTFRATVARAAVEEGAVMVNDISAGELDPAMLDTVAELDVPYVLMHMRGTPATMHLNTKYEDMLKEMLQFFNHKLMVLRQKGIYDTLIDPGFGFSKTITGNFTLLRNLGVFSMLERPLMVGLSRKSMIWRTLNQSPDDSLNGTSVLHTLALLNGASMLRVHDVKAAREVIELYIAYQSASI